MPSSRRCADPGPAAAGADAAARAEAAARDSLTVVDNRTGLRYELPIVSGTVPTADLRRIRTGPDDFGLMAYDPGLANTAAVRSSITYVDGERGVLRYRGYPIEELAERANYLETAYLVIFGELPGAAELAQWSDAIKRHSMVHTNIQRLIETFRYDAHPMSVFISAVASLATLYPDSRDVADPANRRLQVERMVAKAGTIAAFTYRHNQGWPINYPDDGLDYIGNFLRMMFRMTEVDYAPHPALVRALNVLFLLHADHEQNCSTTVMRAIGSSRADPYSALAGAAAALYGPLHGAANEAVLRMLEGIGRPENVAGFVERVKRGECRLMGFGHRVYKNYDPRCRIIKRIAGEVFEATGTTPLLDVALELERIALDDEYFISRRLYPNVDFYSGLIYRAMRLPASMFTVLFAVPRTCGWVAHWLEMLTDEEQRLVRPRQIYEGAELRHCLPGE
ncbi:MAG: citrate synthase [Spirochaetes bacterium]|nr:citrate synthase [Spirochaetota bacterium]MBU1080774.1 citrate synthase [Spirochaetota bacterium]